MTDLQVAGEHTKVFLTKPSENHITSSEATTASGPVCKSLRSCSGDQVRIPPRRHLPSADKNFEEHLTNHKKQRYWNSWEELYLVELWRRYKEEVTSINVPLPVYRKMMIAMRHRNMVVTAQDCRRKINTLNTRYKQELSRMDSTGYKSEWRLFPLIHCVFQPKIKEFDAWQELKIIKKLLDKLPKPVEEASPYTNVNTINNYHTSQPQNTPGPQSNISNYQPRNSYRTSVLNTHLSSAVYADVSSLNRLASSNDPEKPSILPFRNITIEQIEGLRQDNCRLAEQRDADLKCLHMEETNFKCFEEFIRSWTEQKEIELKRVKSMSTQIVKIKGNEENQNVEQQLL